MEEQQKPAVIREFMQSDAYKLIKEWFEARDADITGAIKDHLIKLKWSEKDKWFAYYSGEATIIKAFFDYLERESRREEQQAKVENYVDKFTLRRFWNKS